jgi:hypothetical protein
MKKRMILILLMAGYINANASNYMDDYNKSIEVLKSTVKSLGDHAIGQIQKQEEKIEAFKNNNPLYCDSRSHRAIIKKPNWSYDENNMRFTDAKNSFFYLKECSR